MTKQRNSNIELLRIISMLLIVALHFCVHSGIDKVSLPMGFNRYLLEISYIGNIGVNLFILISGYFLISSKNMFLRQICKLSIQTFTYSASLFIISVLFLNAEISLINALTSFLPVVFGKYWFVTNYILLYTISPFLNSFLKNFTRKQYLYYLAVMLTLVSIVPTITTGSLNLSTLILFILLYSIGAYLRLYPNNIFTNKKFSRNTMLICGAIFLIIPVISDLFGNLNSALSQYYVQIFSKESIFVLLFSTAVFSKVINAKPFSNRFINKMAGCVLGVYLIHDYPTIRYFLWNKWIKVSQFADSPYLILIMIASVLAVFTSCIIIEFFRKSITDWIQNKFLNKHIDSFQNKWNSYVSNLSDRIIAKYEN